MILNVFLQKYKSEMSTKIIALRGNNEVSIELPANFVYPPKNHEYSWMKLETIDSVKVYKNQVVITLKNYWKNLD